MKPRKKKPQLKLVETLYESNFRQVPETLRLIASDIEAKKYGEIGCAALVILGDAMEVFCMGPDSDGTSVATLLQAGNMRIVKAIEEHGK